MENKEKSLPSTSINWYPGHMAKTKRQILEDLKLIDVVVEIIDARIPVSSRNPDIQEMIRNKPKVVILNKYDLANEVENKKWISHFERDGIKSVLVNSNTGDGIKQAINAIEETYKEKKQQYMDKGRSGKAIRVMILGIPNVGKSSFINRVSKKTSATVGNKPGVTRQKQWIRINGNIELLDTPGVLWPKFQNEEIALNLAYTGTIKDDVLQTIEIGFSLLKYLINNHLDKVVERYKLDENEIKDKLNNNNIEENEKVLDIMYIIGRKRGAVVSGGNIDEEKVAKIILDDFRSGKLGRITLETEKN